MKIIEATVSWDCFEYRITVIIMLAAITHQSPNLSGLIQSRSFLTCIVVQWECFWMVSGVFPRGGLGTEIPYILWLCLSLSHWVSKHDPKTAVPEIISDYFHKFPLFQLFICEGLWSFFHNLQPKQHNKQNIKKAHLRICLLLS